MNENRGIYNFTKIEEKIYIFGNRGNALLSRYNYASLPYGGWTPLHWAAIDSFTRYFIPLVGNHSLSTQLINRSFQYEYNVIEHLYTCRAPSRQLLSCIMIHTDSLTTTISITETLKLRYLSFWNEVNEFIAKTSLQRPTVNYRSNMTSNKVRKKWSNRVFNRSLNII